MTKSLSEGGAEGKTKGALSGVKDKAQELFQGSNDDDDDDGEERPRRSSKQRQPAQRRRKRDDDGR
jgi:hypothetical protein